MNEDSRVSSGSKNFSIVEETLFDIKSILKKQGRSSWSLVQVLIATTSLMFAFTFGFSVLKLVQIDGRLETINESKNEIEIMKKSLYEESEYVADLDKARSKILSGQSHYLRKNWLLSERNFSEAIEKLETVYKNIEKKERKGEIKFDSIKTSVTESLKDAYNLQAIANYFIADKVETKLITDKVENKTKERYGDPFWMQTISKMRESGERIRFLDKEDWRGPHFIALAMMKERKPNFNDVKWWFDESIRLNPGINVDYVNLAEFCFIQGHWECAIENAVIYLGLDFISKPEREYVLGFFEDTSEYMSDLIDYDECNIRLENRAKKLNVTSKNFSGQYELKTIKNFRNSLKKGMLLKDVKSAKVQNLILWIDQHILEHEEST